MTIDLTVFRFLNGLAGIAPIWDTAITFCASTLQYVLGALLLLLAMWHFRPWAPKTLLNRRGGYMFVAAIASALIARLGAKSLILLFIHRARPYISLPNVHNLIGPQLGEELQSFPSGHAVFFFALAIAVYRYHKSWGVVFFAGATAMAVARVIGGVHWPSDIVAGAIIGGVIGWHTVQWIPALRRSLPQATEI
jgi:undecaprenyl-diphosphatase